MSKMNTEAVARRLNRRARSSGRSGLIKETEGPVNLLLNDLAHFAEHMADLLKVLDKGTRCPKRKKSPTKTQS